MEKNHNKNSNYNNKKYYIQDVNGQTLNKGKLKNEEHLR